MRVDNCVTGFQAHQCVLILKLVYIVCQSVQRVVLQLDLEWGVNGNGMTCMNHPVSVQLQGCSRSK